MNTTTEILWEVACQFDCTPDDACLSCESHNDYMGYYTPAEYL